MLITLAIWITRQWMLFWSMFNPHKVPKNATEAIMKQNHALHYRNRKLEEQARARNVANTEMMEKWQIVRSHVPVIAVFLKYIVTDYIEHEDKDDQRAIWANFANALESLTTIETTMKMPVTFWSYFSDKDV